MKALAFLSLVLVCGTAAVADEISLKDGSKIVGTVIGFQDNTYQVQTSFGIVTFPKNMISSIVPSSAAPAPAKPESRQPEAKPESKKDAAAKKEPPSPGPQVRSVDAKLPVAKKLAEEKKVALQPGGVAPTQVKADSMQVIPAKQPVVATAAPPPPDAREEVPPIREEVRGNQYINYTYGFRMYKAPSWNLMDDDTRKTLPNAVVALGASDDSTLMVVGVERTKESLESRAAATEKRLREIYENYRRTSEQKTHVAGLPAIERRYRGMADGHDWSGIAVTIARGAEVYTLLGMTYADSDLIQIQENVISRAIASLDFSQK